MKLIRVLSFLTIAISIASCSQIQTQTQTQIQNQAFNQSNEIITSRDVAAAKSKTATKLTVADGIYINPQGSPLVKLIESAKSSIDIEIYQMEDIAVLDALEKAANNGRKIRIVKDGAKSGDGCLVFSEPNENDTESCQKIKALKTLIEEKKGSFVAFNKPALCTRDPESASRQDIGACSEHGKMVLIDAGKEKTQKVLLSTGNFNPTSLCDKNENIKKCNVDYSVVSSDKLAIDTLSKVFENDLKGETYDLGSLLTDEAKKLITVSPFSYESLEDFIKSANKSIKIENQYLKEANFNKVISEMSEKVPVQITVSSICAFGKPKAKDIKSWAKKYDIFSVARDNSKISFKLLPSKFKVNGKHGYLHSKIIIVDSEKAWVGSVNGSNSAFHVNREFGMFINDKKEVKKLEEFVDKTHADSILESFDDSANCLNDEFSEDGSEE